MFVVVIFFWVGSEHKLEWSELLIKLFDLRTNEQTNNLTTVQDLWIHNQSSVQKSTHKARVCAAVFAQASLQNITTTLVLSTSYVHCSVHAMIQETQ